MLPPQLSALLLLALSPAVGAVFQDEVGHLDYHYELLGLPQRETTFFHRPRRDDKASLLYTLTDIGVLGAVNPGNGAVVWRQLLNDTSTTQSAGGLGLLRAGEGENWIASALGKSVHAWDAVSGRNKFWLDFPSEVKDLEIMELTEENRRKDVLVLFDDDKVPVLRRLSGNDGSVVWEFRDTTRDTALQVSTNVERVFVISLRGTPAAYNLKVTVIDTLTGRRMDELVIGTKTDVHSANHVMFVGANSAAPIVAWTDAALTTLRVNVLGTKTRQEFPLAPGTVAVEIHAPRLIQSDPHFLVHSRTATGNRADVYHVDLKTNAITKAYELPLLPGPGAFSTSSSGANVYFTRITGEELTLQASTSHGILGRWPIKAGESTPLHPVHAVAEVIKKAGSTDSYAVRAAAVTDADDWVLIRNGETAWSRPEGMTGAVAAAFAEIPESEDLARTLELEAHSNPLEAYMHRVRRHIRDLQHMPAWLNGIPSRLMSSILGTEIAAKDGQPARDSFGFHKLVILATARGRLYGLDIGNHGRVLWSKRVVDIPKGQKWDVKGMHVDESRGQVTVRGAAGEHVVVKTDTGDIISKTPPGSTPPVQGAALVDSLAGQWLLPIGLNGHIDDLPAHSAPKQVVVVRGGPDEGVELKGVAFPANGQSSSSALTTWTFSLPKGQRTVSIATRPTHDVVASIGRVLGDRRVKYKYLNPNTLVLAAADDAASTLTVYLLDAVSGQILSSTTHEGVDTGKPVECAMAENWFLCTFFGQYTLRENPTQSLRGYQVVVSDLYETEEPNDRGPLGDAANFSSVDPIRSPTGVALPSVVSQAYVLAAPISALQVTQTRQGISARQVLAYLPEAHGIVGIPRILLDPRRPVGRDPTAAEIEEGLIKYSPVIEMDPKFVITHERDVLGVKKIITAPSIVESTSLVFAYGIDVFGTRVAPSMLFDILGKGFNKVALIGTVLAIMAGVVALSPMVRKKQIDMRWKAPM
ncbi:DUF1620-domain-containing protein [Diplogelasinospora grovesii]|uniref:ER membrane protein complex subunit 1 n=1 Tax=Diplogelasinospora grovesii TaxID=303347 RepID=A0AAN6RZ29_9PEZI|nr:DUF1620-domain-containing protein [Diplogelasinospora grovesii]